MERNPYTSTSLGSASPEQDKRKTGVQSSAAKVLVLCSFCSLVIVPVVASIMTPTPTSESAGAGLGYFAQVVSWTWLVFVTLGLVATALAWGPGRREKSVLYMLFALWMLWLPALAFGGYMLLPLVVE